LTPELPVKIETRLLVALTLAAACAGALARDLVVLSAGAVKPALSTLAPQWEARSGHRLLVTFLTAGELRRKLAAGEVADVIILPLENFAAIEAEGRSHAASRRDLGAVGIGVAVRPGVALPDLSSEEGFKRLLVDAKSLTYMDPTRGTSGKHLDEVVLPRLGLRDAVRAKTVFGEGGMIAEKVARGEVDVAIQQMTELLPVAGVQVAGYLPAVLQKTTVYSGAVMHAARSPAEAAELLDWLISADVQAVFAARGFSKP
jgi:molybdate transport system substrate-binding protein